MSEQNDQTSVAKVVTKAVPLYAIELDEHEGIVKGFPAVLGNWDLDREMIPPGAFAATIAGAGKRAPMGRDHKHPLGVTTLLQEVTRGDLPARMKAEYPDAAGALYAEGVVSMFPDNLEWLQEEKRRIAKGNPSGMSFVGKVLRVAKARHPDGDEGTVLGEIALKEWGPTPSLVHRNRAAGVMAVKATDDDTRLDDDIPFDLAGLLELSARKAELVELLRAEKAGRALSGANAKRALAAARELLALLQAAGITLDDEDEGSEPAASKASADSALPVDAVLYAAEARLRLHGQRLKLLGV